MRGLMRDAVSVVVDCLQRSARWGRGHSGAHGMAFSLPAPLCLCVRLRLRSLFLRRRPPWVRQKNSTRVKVNGRNPNLDLEPKYHIILSKIMKRLLSGRMEADPSREEQCTGRLSLSSLERDRAQRSQRQRERERRQPESSYA